MFIMTELVFILDRSGSMSGMEKDTIGGFNSMIAKQRGEPGEALVSTVLFDNDIEVIHDRVPLEKVSLLTEEEYNTFKLLPIALERCLIFLIPTVVIIEASSSVAFSKEYSSIL